MVIIAASVPTSSVVPIVLSIVHAWLEIFVVANFGQQTCQRYAI
jgi:hypothetical protein